MSSSGDPLFERKNCPEGSLGLGVWRFYRARGFTFPGRPESAPPNLAQHDWIHVLAEYGSTVEVRPIAEECPTFQRVKEQLAEAAV